MGTEQEAQEKFTKIPRHAGAGEPQGVSETSVVAPRGDYGRFETFEQNETHLAKWLVKHLAGLGEIELPSRMENRPSPFEGWSDEDFAE